MHLYSIYAMKIFLEICIILFFGSAGYFYKNKYKESLKTLNMLHEFACLYDSNISLFKNDLQEIINNYIITHKNKNANYCKFILKNDNIYQFNMEFLKNKIIDKNTFNVIQRYLIEIGKSEYEYEKEKNRKFEQFLTTKIIEENKLEKEKGGLGFKLMLALGAVVAIVIW